MFGFGSKKAKASQDIKGGKGDVLLKQHLGNPNGLYAWKMIETIRTLLVLADYGNKPAEEVQQDACKLIIKVAMNLQDKKGKPSDFDAAKAAAIDLATTYLQVRLRLRLPSR